MAAQSYRLFLNEMFLIVRLHTGLNNPLRYEMGALYICSVLFIWKHETRFVTLFL